MMKPHKKGMLKKIKADKEDEDEAIDLYGKRQEEMPEHEDEYEEMQEDEKDHKDKLEGMEDEEEEDDMPVESAKQFRFMQAARSGNLHNIGPSPKVADEMLKKTPKKMRSKFAKAKRK
jgi:hypothetical protein